MSRSFRPRSIRWSTRDWLHAPGKPTVLVLRPLRRPAARSAGLWISPPFEPTVRDGNLYARGSADDKGQMYMHIKAVEALRAVNGTLPVNLKFLIEGEEEVGGESIAKYVAENPAKLKADVALVSDTELYAEGMPTLCIGLRGLIYTGDRSRAARCAICTPGSTAARRRTRSSG